MTQHATYAELIDGLFGPGTAARMTPQPRVVFTFDGKHMATEEARLELAKFMTTAARTLSKPTVYAMMQRIGRSDRLSKINPIYFDRLRETVQRMLDRHNARRQSFKPTPDPTGVDSHRMNASRRHADLMMQKPFNEIRYADFLKVRDGLIGEGIVTARQWKHLFDIIMGRTYKLRDESLSLVIMVRLLAVLNYAEARLACIESMPVR